MMKRLIVRIDEERCDGCGMCIPACAEGALQIVDGKARLMAENLCDGLGACLGHCRRGAITVEERESAPFTPPPVTSHESAALPPPPAVAEATPLLPCGCPASVLDQPAPPALQHGAPSAAEHRTPPAQEERALPALGNWPVQIRLVPPGAPFLRDAHLVVAADCAAFACPDFHRRFLTGRVLLVGCPKLDDAYAYIDRLAAIMATARPRAITVLHMEVPCCYGMTYVVQQALARAGLNLPVEDVIITPSGEVRPAPTPAGDVRT